MTAHPIEGGRPERLIVVGAAAGIGRWLGDHVFSTMAWEHVTLLDAAPAVLELKHGYRAPVTRVQTVADASADYGVDLRLSSHDRSANVHLGLRQSMVVTAVPLATLPHVAPWLLPQLADDTIVVDVSHDRSRAAAILDAVRTDLPSIGLHALFGTTAQGAEGQTFVLCPCVRHPAAHLWLAEVIERAGGTINVLTAARHDEIMRYVQTASHQALLTFVDVIGGSGLDLEHDLWANRTPIFELLLALAGRTLAPGQEATTGSIQQADEDEAVARAFNAAEDRLRVQAKDVDGFVDYLESLRAPFSGALFTRVQQAGALATSAVQSSRAQIAHHRRMGTVVGVVTQPRGRLHAGVIERLTPTSFVLRDLIAGRPGGAALLHGPEATENARRLGIAGRPREIEFVLGRVRILTPEELEAALDEELATVSRGLKVLVPESISGSSAASVIDSVPAVRSTELISEEVRIGERECVVRYTARVDRDLAAIERDIQLRIDQIFVWPEGVVLPVSQPKGLRIGYLGPAGTFSDVAARQLGRLQGLPDVPRVEFSDFHSIVRAVEDRSLPAAVLPITSSSSGLVDFAASALHAARGIQGGGVIDVPVRIDAYTAPGGALRPGVEVFSHPQALRQCSEFIHANGLVEVPWSSTTDACLHVLARGEGIALAPAGLEKELGTQLARANVGNLAGALTRFLVISRIDGFAPPPRADALLRSIWIIGPGEWDAYWGAAERPRFDEVLRGGSGHTLVVSTEIDHEPTDRGGRFLGTIPWSPRTPIVSL